MKHSYEGLDFTGKTPDQIEDMKRRYRKQQRNAARKAGTYTPQSRTTETPKGTGVTVTKKARHRPAAQRPAVQISMKRQHDNTYTVFVGKDAVGFGFDHWDALVRVRELELLNTPTGTPEADEVLRLLELARRCQATSPKNGGLAKFTATAGHPQPGPESSADA